MQKSEQTFVTVKGKIRKIRPAPPSWFKLNLTHYPSEVLSMFAFGFKDNFQNYTGQNKENTASTAVLVQTEFDTLPI